MAALQKTMILNRKLALPETILARLGYTRDKIAQLADRHTMAVQSWLSTRYPRAKCFKGLGVRAGSSGLNVPLLNLALGCNFPVGTPDEVIDYEIEVVKTLFAERDVPWSWWVGPHPRPANMGQYFARHGLRAELAAVPSLVSPLSGHFPAPNPQVRIWQAASLADLEAASTIRRTAFRFPDGVALDYFEAMAEDWLRGAPARLYLARLGDGPPAAIGALIMGAGIPGVYIMATLPQWGRRGLGSAILARILTQAAAEGHGLIALTASTKYGYPLYRRFGFEHIFNFMIYRLRTGPIH